MENIMILHEDKEAFSAAIRAASDYLGIRDVFVEKDYWVTYLLRRLSLSEYADRVVFKGGTSLSKVFGLISRFSEDVDLAILKAEGQTETQVRNLIREVEKSITSGFIELEIPGLTSKQKNYRKTGYNYNRILDRGNTGIQNQLILELNSFANPVPFSRHSINSMVAQYLTESDNDPLIERYHLEPFDLFVLDPMVTLIEKLLSLVRLSFYDDGIDRIRAKVRHFYDIYFLTRRPEFHEPENISRFVGDFSRMFDDEKTRFHDPENWMQSSYTDSPLFMEFDDIWRSVRGSYDTDFRLLVYGEFPDSDAVLKQIVFLIELLSHNKTA
jgi:hypothetical protein